jgi:hypothetical protein
MKQQAAAMPKATLVLILEPVSKSARAIIP